jgi:dimethylargininase
MTIAITRAVSPRFAECELTHIERVPIDLDLARAQHQDYIEALRSIGCSVVELPAEPDLPDSVFVEDTAVILPELAILTRPGADSRKPEIQSIAEVLRSHRELAFIREPGTLDGGDVLVMDRDIYVGLSSRSDPDAIAQLQAYTTKFGYKVRGVEMDGCLHLKSAVTSLGANRVLMNRGWLDTRPFANYEMIDVAVSEPYAANILMIGGTGIYPSAFPETERALKKLVVDLLTLDVSELAKAEGAVTCCSLIIP